MKNKKQFILFLLILLSLTGFSSGITDNKIIARITTPDYISFQYAGNLGLASVGLGYLTNDHKLNFSVSYGYLPSSINSAEIHTASAKGLFNFRKHRIAKSAFINGYAGTNLIRSFTNNTYMKFPGHYPSGYYVPNAVHFAPFFGAKLGSRKNINKFSYIELGTLDYYLINSIKHKEFKFRDNWNLCMGITVPLSNPASSTGKSQ